MWEGPSCVPHPRPAAVCELVSITTNVCSWQSRACFRTDDGDGQLSIICGAGKELRPCRHDLLVRRFGLPCLVACLACWPVVFFLPGAGPIPQLSTHEPRESEQREFVRSGCLPQFAWGHRQFVSSRRMSFARATRIPQWLESPLRRE